jgi:hypothetical protein
MMENILDAAIICYGQRKPEWQIYYANEMLGSIPLNFSPELNMTITNAGETLPNSDKVSKAYSVRVHPKCHRDLTFLYTAEDENGEIVKYKKPGEFLVIRNPKFITLLQDVNYINRTFERSR